MESPLAPISNEYAQMLSLLNCVPYFQRTDLAFSYLGPHFLRVFGFEPTRLLNHAEAFGTLLGSRERDHVLQHIADLAESEKKESIRLTYCMHNPQTHGIVYIQDVRTPVYTKEGKLLGYRGVLQNITRQQVAEHRLAHTAWKEHLAVVTSGLIHDFNNIMAGIHSLAELYYDKVDPDDSMREGLSQIKKSAFQAQTLCRRIVDLNRENQAGPTYHNIEDLVRDQVDLIKAALPKHTQIETHFSGQELPVYLDDTLFRQVMLNLGINARDALPKKGKITIHVKRIAKGEKTLCGTTSEMQAFGDGVEIIFADNGSGIPQKHQASIFDAFFTTKQSTKGSGFGLYNARLFFEKNGGSIDVKSNQEEGTSFHMFLPLATFQECSLMDDDEHETRSQRRPCLLLYSCIDPETLELTNLMRNRKWEVITFTCLHSATSYLAETILPPQLAVAVDIGHDNKAAQLLDSISHLHPNIQTALHVIGRNPDSLPEQLTRKVDLLLQEDLPDTQIVQELSRLLPH